MNVDRFSAGSFFFRFFLEKNLFGQCLQTIKIGTTILLFKIIRKMLNFVPKSSIKMPNQIQIHDLFFEKYITKKAIQSRVEMLGAAIGQRFRGDIPLFVSVLSGSFVFTSDLIREVKGDLEINFVKLASYRGTASTGEISVILDLAENIEGRHLVVVEDIVDTGTTLHFFLEKLREKNPASLTVVALLVKPDALKYPVSIDFTGFEIPNAFVVGYGLDYNELGRNLPDIWQLTT
jgi:hypoxanthine phosphoribosyltransferase